MPDFRQCVLRLCYTLPMPLSLFGLPGQALTVTGDLREQIERIWCEAEFLLGNWQTFSPFYTPSATRLSA
jgi:hypothetical protein